MMTSSRPSRCADLFLFYCLVACVLSLGATACAQTYSVLYNFNNGSGPTAGLSIDQGGNLYGVTQYGGHSNQHCQVGCGTVYRLTYKQGGWVMTPLYLFSGGSDGAFPMARVVFGPDGSLYGTTQSDEQSCQGWGDCGTVFRLRPQTNPCPTVSCPWSKTVLYRFTGGIDGSLPGSGDLIFDQAGRIYGTTQAGGTSGLGAVYLLTPAGGSWNESVLYSFSGLDGSMPVGGVVLDRNGNVLGTTAYGGPGYHPPQYYGAGTIFQLTSLGSGWSESTIFAFHDTDDGALPYAALTFDNAGNLYGTAGAGGGGSCLQGGEMYGGCGTLFSFSAGVQTLYMFPGDAQFVPAGPRAPMTSDSAGNLYGTYYGAGTNGLGGIFKLTAGSHQYVALHDFQDGELGGNPVSNVVMDRSGNLYGVAGGVVWKITP